MSSISFSGLATGIDTASLVKSLVQIETIPIERLRVKQKNHDSMSSRLGTIRTRLNTLAEAMKAITENSAPASVRSSNEGAVKASTIGPAVAGAYVVEVTSLASAERTHSDGVASKDTAGYWRDNASIGITVGSDAEVTIDVSSADTLESVARRINESDARVTASIIFDGSEYRLQISGDDTGAENAISFNERRLNLGLERGANQSVAASDAVFSVDGLSMTRSSNEVSEAVPGLRLDLGAITTGPVTVTVGADSESLSQRMDAVVEAYNSVMNGINVESVFTGTARTGDSLSGDSTLRGLQSSLRGAFFSALPGFSTLAEIGLSTNRSGAIELNKEAFAAALNENPGALLKAFAGDGATTGLFQRLQTTVDAYSDKNTGLLSQRIDNFGTQNRRIDDRISSMEVRIDKFEQNLLNKFAAMETLVSGLKSQGEQMLAILGGL